MKELDYKLRRDLTMLNKDFSESREDSSRNSYLSTVDIDKFTELKPETEKDLKEMIDLEEEELPGEFVTSILKLIKKYRLEHKYQNLQLSEDSHMVLEMYKHRLNNIARDNKNLYVKENRSNIADLYDVLEDKVLSAIITNQKLPKNGLELSWRNREISETSSYERFKTIHRNMKSLYREGGVNDLYFTYPYVEGRYVDKEPFPVRAPLLFFPVKLEKMQADFYLMKDSSRPIIVNKDLIFANNKYSVLDAGMEFPEYESMSMKTFEKDVLPFYEKNGLIFENTKDFLEEQGRFVTFDGSSDDFSKKEPARLTLLPYAVLGLFPIHSSSIQADIATILKTRKSNSLIRSLLSDYSLDDVHVEHENEEYGTKVPPGGFFEKEIRYISPLNYAQEKVLANAEKSRKNVVWGPPGTGKTQTIMNLVVNNALKGRNVLVVSSKKVALDVILERCAQDAPLMVHVDDPGDKNDFYDQIHRVTDQLGYDEKHYNQKKSELKRQDDMIDKLLMDLRSLRDHFYRLNKQGFRLNDLYDRYLLPEHYDDVLPPDKVEEEFKKQRLNKLPYRNLQEIETTMGDIRTAKLVYCYHKAVSGTELENMRTDLIDTDYRYLKEFQKRLENFHTTCQKEGALGRLTLRRRFIKRHGSWLNDILCNPEDSVPLLKRFIKNPQWARECLDNFEEIDRGRKEFTALPQETKDYVKLFTRLYHKAFDNEYELKKFNQYLFDAFYTHYIDQAERKNKDSALIFGEYDRKISRLDKEITQKQTIVRDLFSEKLRSYVVSYKRENEIKFREISYRTGEHKKKTIKNFFKQFQYDLLSMIKVWLMTPEAVSEIFPLDRSLFDLVIFDEASQMHPERAIPSLYRAKKAVVAGDAKQLRPSIFAQATHLDDEYLNVDEDTSMLALEAESLLDLARLKYDEIILNYHYRSDFEELIAFSNTAFYRDKLFLSPNKRIPEEPPIEYHLVKNGIWDDQHNTIEAEFTVDLITKILANKDPDETLGVITFNRKQSEVIEEIISDRVDTDSTFAKLIEPERNRREGYDDRSLFIKNIENVQGDERDIIVFSLGYAKNPKGKFIRNFGALNKQNGENRLNVAITRARRKIHFVASITPSQFGELNLQTRGPLLLQKYMKYCWCISHKEYERARDLLDEVARYKRGQDKKHWRRRLGEDIKNKLEKESFSVDVEVGMGLYAFDLVVSQEGSDIKLGIICDVDANVETDQVRNYFYHHEKYFQTNHWDVYRVFARNWWKNHHKELERIKEKFEESSKRISAEVSEVRS